MYYAHSTDDPSCANWHGLAEHLTRVADLAGQFGAGIGVAKAAALAGLLHDLGKYTPAFQARLRGAQERVDHSTAGAAIVRQLAKAPADRILAEMIAYAIAGHHAGLPDRQGASGSSLSERLKGFSETLLDPVWKTEINPEPHNMVPAFLTAQPKSRERLCFRLAFLGRMIFSCLVDADFKDTEAFFAHTQGHRIDRDWPDLSTALTDLCKAFDRHMAGFGSADTDVNRLRTDILTHVRAQARKSSGLFTLTVPTGGGKTLASLGFALDHALARGHKRIIYAIPYTAIIDQTAAIFRTILGDAFVLEHHSAIDEENVRGADVQGADSTAASRAKISLAMEDWAAPVIITTNVQLFESLFAARPSRCRKLHNIANSVIILDEAQTLPRPFLAPSVWALRELAENYGCSVILCTATQPALDARHFPQDHPVGLELEGRELAPEPAALARKLTRVRLRHAGAMEDSALIEALAAQPQGLVIVNSRKHAMGLFRAAQSAELDGLIHLTTRQYAAHRQRILDDVRQRLKRGESCRLIATSLVEAGVDLDFPKVWRAEAGLDQIAQAAGRCNREGRRPLDESLVTIFEAPENPPPADIARLAADMRRVLDKHRDHLLSPAALAEFFAEVYWRVGREGVDKENILEHFKVSGGETDFAYRGAAEKFRMIETGLAPVIVRIEAQAQDALDKLRIGTIPSGGIARALQRHIVQVPPRARARLIACGHVRFYEESLRGNQFAVLVSDSLYKKDVGLVWEDAEYLTLEQSVI